MKTTAAFRLGPDGLDLFLKVTPKAAQDRVEGLRQTAQGTTRLIVKVTAPPDQGKANAAVIRLLSKALGLAACSFTIITGETDRYKTLRLSVTSAEQNQILSWLETRKTA